MFSTPAYSIETTDDVAGLEVAAAMKNAYGVAIGIADGIEKRPDCPMPTCGLPCFRTR